ncbi:MarR family winged helix-turn-helix transcriptional regulator [Nocardia donostiensis]|uniref:Transcriptional regulator n=1 Tax=Nocardia donostiensis TaxID=1538463 RepID=A0A1W0AZS9_9NOCA|nr:MarR family transcriptional regulator [Nocardia donostiensis]ONM50111.1 transcriptional regulator [Nocardia donostiensis]OQS15773.1 transcriptional regulator [Nocardia donostiensis]OQS23578.1 transcriptional regulator [Nocardia donostiensis]
MSVSSDTAQGLIRELFLIGRAIRATLAHPEEGQLLPGGVGVLVALETKGPCRQVDLAAGLCISPSALSRHVTELVTDGYVSRHPDPSDGRATVIQVTDNGRDLLQRIRMSRAKGLQDVLAEWSEDEAEQARAVVHKLRNTMTAHGHRSAAAEQKAVPEESQVPDVQYS